MTAENWSLPPLESVLEPYPEQFAAREARRYLGKIEKALADFEVEAEIRNIHYGPRFTKFSLKPGSDTQINKIKRLEPDLAVALSGALDQIEEPRPGYPYLNLMVENQRRFRVHLLRVIESSQFARHQGALKIPLGIDTFGLAVVFDLAALPHLLIGGTTGSGKSSCLHALITGLLCVYPPTKVQFVLIDPMAVELKPYNGIPHLFAPVVTNTAQVLDILTKIHDEIQARYQQLARFRARDIGGYNEKLSETGQKPMPYLVVIIDNLFDLMIDAPKEVEQILTRIAQKARGAGVHLTLATLRSSVSAVAGSIKANFPGRIALRVVDRPESQLILDVAGAERLKGAGDMLFKSPHSNELRRVQGVYVSPQEIKRVVQFWRNA